MFINQLQFKEVNKMEYTLQIIGAIAIMLMVLVPIWKFLKYLVSPKNTEPTYNKIGKHSLFGGYSNDGKTKEEIELDAQIANEIKIKEEEAYALVVRARVDKKRARLLELRAIPSTIENEIISQIDEIKEDETIVQEDIALEKERINGNRRIQAANDRLARQMAILEELRGTK